MIKKILIAFLVVVGIVGAIAGVKATQIKALIAAAESMPPQSEAVTSVQAREEVWRSYLRAVGTFRAVQGVALSNELPGVVAALHFESGESVEKGQLLVELDTSTEQAQLQAAKATLALAELRLERARELRGKDTVAQSDLDAAEAQYLEAEAAVKNIESVIAKKRIVAPFAGRLGLRKVDVGQFLGAGSSIVSLQALDPIFVDFTLPQQRLGLVETGMDIEARLDAYPGEAFAGRLSAITPEVEIATRSGALRATLDNDDGKLRPGMFANVSVLLPQTKPVLVVPATAVLHAPYGDSVYMIETSEQGGQVALQKFVRVLERRGDFVAIEAGLQPGDEIVATGVFKLRNGMAVRVNSELRPDAQLNPLPQDA